MQPAQQLSIKQTMPLFSPIYDQQYLKNINILQTAIKNRQFTKQMNQLAQHILYDQSGDYNCWYIKKMYILSEDKTQELYQEQQDFVDRCLESKVKGFQVWEQKRFLNQVFSKGTESQLGKVQKILLTKDQKNYHAWSYRVWLADFGHLHELQINFAMKMIKNDAFNNSAWSYLYFVIQHIGSKMQQTQRINFLNRYVNFALENIAQHKGNRASWNFLRGLFPSIKLKNFPCKNKEKTTLASSFNDFPQIYEHCQKQWKDFHEKEGETKKQTNQAQQIQILNTLLHILSQNQQNLTFAQNICEQLKEKEPLRKHYWTWIQNNLQ